MDFYSIDNKIFLWSKNIRHILLKKQNMTNITFKIIMLIHTIKS